MVKIEHENSKYDNFKYLAIVNSKHTNISKMNIKRRRFRMIEN